MQETTRTNSEAEEVRLGTTQLPSDLIEVVGKIRSLRGCTIPQAYVRYILPHAIRELAKAVDDERKRLRKDDPAFANELGGEAGGA